MAEQPGWQLKRPGTAPITSATLIPASPRLQNTPLDLCCLTMKGLGKAAKRHPIPNACCVHVSSSVAGRGSGESYGAQRAGWRCLGLCPLVCHSAAATCRSCLVAVSSPASLGSATCLLCCWPALPAVCQQRRGGLQGLQEGDCGERAALWLRCPRWGLAQLPLAPLVREESAGGRRLLAGSLTALPHPHTTTTTLLHLNKKALVPVGAASRMSCCARWEARRGCGRCRGWTPR